MNGMNGIINVYKEKGFTSFDVCAKLRGILKQKKIGHTGTLDPDAEGVLPICVGNATKLCDLLTDKDKVYEAVMLLGITTDTQDITGKVITESSLFAGEEEVRTAIHKFIGTYDQMPPMYSAIKVNGKRLYELARQGIEVERKTRPVTIHEIEILSMKHDEENEHAVKEVHMRVHCSKGTYIRTLCEDIGNTLNCGACMKALLRTRVSIFDLSSSKRLNEIEEYVKQGKTEELLISVDSLFPSYPKAYTGEESDKLLYNGNKLDSKQLMIEHVEITDQPERIRVYDSKHVFAGIYQMEGATGSYRPYKMFLNQ